MEPPQLFPRVGIHRVFSMFMILTTLARCCRPIESKLIWLYFLGYSYYDNTAGFSPIAILFLIKLAWTKTVVFSFCRAAVGFWLQMFNLLIYGLFLGCFTSVIILVGPPPLAFYTNMTQGNNTAEEIDVYKEKVGWFSGSLKDMEDMDFWHFDLLS